MDNVSRLRDIKNINQKDSRYFSFLLFLVNFEFCQIFTEWCYINLYIITEES